MKLQTRLFLAVQNGTSFRFGPVDGKMTEVCRTALNSCGIKPDEMDSETYFLLCVFDNGTAQCAFTFGGNGVSKKEVQSLLKNMATKIFCGRVDKNNYSIHIMNM